MRINHDIQADALYIQLTSEPYAYGRDLDEWRRIDYSADGFPVGIEILNVSEGVNVGGLPNSREVAKAIESKGLTAYFMEHYTYTAAGFMQNTLILADMSDKRVEAFQSRDSIAVFDLWFDSPTNPILEASKEVITA